MKKDCVNISDLADEPQLEDYQQKPVQNYGMALLKGMGFSETKGIGKSKNNQLNDIYVLKARPRGQGLGAQTQQQTIQQKFEVGDKILITQQPHKGLTGYVNEIINDETLSIELHPSKSIVKINIKCLKRISKSQMKKIQQQGSKQDEKKKKKRIKWVVPQIRVKVTDPKSQFYLKKVIVTELISQRQFECRDETGKILNNLSENDIQTIIPKNGGTVLILKGQHLGGKAIVMDRKKSKGQVTVQTVQQLQMIKISQDDISQYVQI